MKKIVSLLMFSALFAACKKSDDNSSNNNNNNISLDSNINIITLTNNGVTHTAREAWAKFTDSKYKAFCLLEISSGTNGSTLGIVANADEYDFRLDIDSYHGPANGIGKYTQNTNTHFIEKYNGNKQWGTDSVQVFVTSVDSGRVKGNFTLWLIKDSEKKTVTGTFDCKQ